MSEQGHLFVVHGRIESLVHDAAIVPAGEEFHFASYWRPLVGGRPRRPGNWSDRGFGRVVNAPDEVWALDVGPTGRVAPYEVVLQRLEGALRLVDEGRDALSRVRGEGSLPLVALPVVGIGYGGHGRARGDVIRTLTALMHHLARELGLDIALVTPEPAVYAAAQYARRDQPTLLTTEVERHAHDVGQQARRGELALLLGAGVSVAAGLPTWHGLVQALSKGVDLPPVNEGAPLSPVDQAELIQLTAKDEFKKELVSIVGRARRPSLLHGLLAGMDGREVVTTNYDLLYEQAVEATGREIASVMPWKSAQGARRWVLKLHGDTRHPESIVLTRREMVRYDSTSRPSGALLQSLLLTKRLLVVGTSMTDDNVLRLAHEVLDYRKENKVAGPLGTVLDAGNDRARAQLWSDSLTWLPLGAQLDCDGPRGVELFLDRVATHSARDSSWLLDWRFEGLLAAPDRALAEDVRTLARRIGETREDDKWSLLRETLRDLGAP